jgi:hypothetical protein
MTCSLPIFDIAWDCRRGQDNSQSLFTTFKSVSRLYPTARVLLAAAQALAIKFDFQHPTLIDPSCSFPISDGVQGPLPCECLPVFRFCAYRQLIRYAVS